jgi:uncharacterized protein (TIGR03435 family)
MFQRVQIAPKRMFLFIVVALITASSVNSQNAPDKRRAFEVASIKLSDPSSKNFGIGTAPGGRFTANNWTLKGLIGFAYRVQGDQIFGGPPWIDSDRFEVAAKAEEGSIPDDDRPASPDELPPIRYLIQTLLAERFNLKLHRDVRDLSVFELGIAKNGPKLQKTESETSVAPQIGARHIYAKSITVKAFCAALALDLRRAVMDKTGLEGTYQIHLEWSGNLTDSRDPAASSSVEDGASIFTAIEEQLGLRLESRKTGTPVIIVDSADKLLPD